MQDEVKLISTTKRCSTKLMFFYQIEDCVSWPPHFNDNFGFWEHLLTPIWVTKEWNRPQKGLNMVLNGKFSQPYVEYLVQAWITCRAVSPLLNIWQCKSRRCWEVEQGPKDWWENFVTEKSRRSFLTNHEWFVLPPNISNFYSVYQTCESVYPFSMRIFLMEAKLKIEHGRDLMIDMLAILKTLIRN